MIVRCNKNLVFFQKNANFGDQLGVDWEPQQSLSSPYNKPSLFLKKMTIKCSHYLC